MRKRPDRLYSDRGSNKRGSTGVLRVQGGVQKTYIHRNKQPEMYWIIILCYFYSIKAFVDTKCLVCSYSSEWWTLFTYPLYHENIFHLILNCYAIMIYWRFLKVRVPQNAMIVILTAAVPLSGLIASFSGTGGSSTIACGLMGIYLALYPNAYKRYAFMLAFNAVVSIFFPVNFIIHVVSMAIAFFLMRAMRKYVYVIV